ncbi:MAG: peptidyl-prolyl cis-trans isomerase [candidate division WOR-3 bacterium]|nr:peptidyl-prolyl cis-trans isomerase [candidate division WOR-3 bacterium]
MLKKQIILSLLITSILFLFAQNNFLTPLYNNYYLTGEWEKGIKYLDSLLSLETKPDRKVILLIEKADIYFDKLRDYKKAEEIYQEIINNYKKSKFIPEVYYRLGLIKELEENYLEAAQIFEKVVVEYPKSKYAEDALDAIERCFKKNYIERVALVDGWPITQIEFDERIARNPTAYEKFEDKLKLLNEMIDERLLYSEAKKRELFPLIKENYNEHRKMLIFQQWYNDEIVNKIKVSKKEKKDYYKKNKGNYIKEEQVKAREILVKDLQTALNLREKFLKNELIFDSVAKDTTINLSPNKNGDLGYFRKGTYPKEIEKVAFKLKINEISKPIKTKEGYVLLKCEDKKPKEVKKFKDVEGDIELRIKNEKINKYYEEKIKTLMTNSSPTIDTQAIKENKEEIAKFYNITIKMSQLENRISRLPPFIRPQFETPEGKARLVENIIQEYLILKEAESTKCWLRNVVFGQLQERLKSLLINELKKQEVSNKITLKEEELKKDYKANLKDFFVPEQVKAREIVVRSLELANKVRIKLLKEKIPFDSLVKEYSVSQTKYFGGDLGYFSKDDKHKPKEVIQFAFKANKGEISKPIKLNDTTFVIIKKEDHKKAYHRPFNEVKDKIERKLRKEKEDKRYQEFIADLRKKANIEILLKEEVEEKKEIEEEK